ncbi:hypothetical protein ACHAWF_005111 [Thalassiosira exigua]
MNLSACPRPVPSKVLALKRFRTNLQSGIMAVKVLRIPRDDKRAVVEDLRREIDLMKSLKHKNIVRYLGAEADRNNEVLNIFQEWAPGGSVESLLRKHGPFPIPVVKSYARQVLGGLEYLHSHGIIHRDIKGGNILVSSDGSIKLADFGASKRVEAFEESDEMELTMRGTPYFMAPEVFEERYGSKADVWSVGCVLYQMVTRSPPWKGLGFKSPISLFMFLKDRDGPPELPPLKYCEGCDRTLLEGMMSKCFRRDPSLRPCASELLKDEFLDANAASVLRSPRPTVERSVVSRTSSRPPGDADSGRDFVPQLSPSSESPFGRIPEDEALLADSLCYSLTLRSPLPKISTRQDTSDWPEWARNCHDENTSKGGPNPYASRG